MIEVAGAGSAPPGGGGDSARAIASTPLAHAWTCAIMSRPTIDGRRGPDPRTPAPVARSAGASAARRRESLRRERGGLLPQLHARLIGMAEVDAVQDPDLDAVLEALSERGVAPGLIDVGARDL